jgi:hypothetical protein
MYWCKIMYVSNNDNAISWVYDGHSGSCISGIKELMYLPKCFVLMFGSL